MGDAGGFWYREGEEGDSGVDYVGDPEEGVWIQEAGSERRAGVARAFGGGEGAADCEGGG